MIKCEVTINAPIVRAWKLWTSPEHIAQWNIPFDNWHTPKVENDLVSGGEFLYRMESKDAKEGFDYSGRYDKVIPFELIEAALSDGRKSIIKFKAENNKTMISETFEPEHKTPVDIQRNFCQSVLNNFKSYAEHFLSIQ